MFRKQAFHHTLRSPRRSLLFLLLLALISALLTTSLGMTVSLSRALALCRENYITIGLAEYIGGGYPELQRMDSAIDGAAAALETALPEDEALLYYEPTRTALGYTEGLRVDSSYENAVLLVRVNKVTQDYGGTPCYYSTVQKACFAARELEGKIINLTGRSGLQKNGLYLVHCVHSTNGLFMGLPNYVITPYTSPDGSVTLSGLQQLSDGSAIPEDSPYLLAAKTHTVAASGLTVWCSDDPQALYPFQQNELTLSAGDWCRAGGCLLPEETAKVLGVTVGDTLTIGTAAREGTLLKDAYWAGSGFDTEKEYRVDGLFNGSEDWNRTAFIPVDADMPTIISSYTLGQLRFVNGEAQGYLDSVADALPAGVRVTVYDQGYAAAESGLGTMLRSVGIISAVCLAAGIGFLLLFAYLLIFRQQSEARNMIRLGVTRGQVLRFDAYCALFPALPGCAVGFAVSVAACGVLEQLVASILAQTGSTDLHFSNSALSVSRDMGDFLSAPSLLLLALLAAAVLLAAVLLAVLFGALTLRRRRSRRSFLPRRSGARSRSLRGGSVKYALLSLFRGGLRSAVPVVALVCAAVLFCRLAAVTVRTQEELAALRSDSDAIRGYATDVDGRSLSGLVVSRDAVQQLSAVEGVTDVTVGRSAHYDFVYAYHQDGRAADGPGYHPRSTTSSFGWETFLNYLQGCDEVLFTSSLAGAPEFLYAKSVQAEYMEGWDETLFSAEDPQFVCVLPTTLMEQYHITFGDSVLLEMIDADNNVFSMTLKVVGSYTQEGAANHIYIPAALAPGYHLTSFNYSSVTFTVPRCDELEQVKSGLYDAGFSEANHARTIRTFLALNDASYLNSLHAAEQRLWYMERLFPLIDALAVALAFFLGRLLLGRRAGEIRTLRSMGASGGLVFRSLFLEQLLLALPGTGIGAAICIALQEWGRTGQLWLLAFTLSYLIGALAALLRTNRRAILKNRREQEA